MDTEHNSEDRPHRTSEVDDGPSAGTVGAGTGLLGGGLAGAAIGTAVAGPLGTLVGAIIGAATGGAAGKVIGDQVDPDAEDRHWSNSYKSEPYVRPEHKYEDLRAGYQTGFQGHGKYEPGTLFEDAEATLREDYEAHHASGSTASLGSTGTGHLGGADMSVTHAKSTPETTASSHAKTTIETAAAEIPAVAAPLPNTTTTTGNSGASAKLPWEEAKHAAKAAWNRVEKGEAIRVPITEEQVEIGKREVEAGAVRLRKVVKTEIVNQPVEIRREEVIVEKVAPGTPGAIAEDAFAGGEIVVPVKREEAVVTKSAHVAGIVTIEKTQGSETQQISETVRKEEVKIEDERTGEPQREV